MQGHFKHFMIERNVSLSGKLYLKYDEFDGWSFWHDTSRIDKFTSNLVYYKFDWITHMIKNQS